MYCPECKSENSDSAKFCKKCGKPLKPAAVSHDKVINNISKGSSNNDTTKIIIIALVVVAVVLAGAFIYLYGFSNDTGGSHDNSAQSANDNNKVSNDDKQVSNDDDEPKQATQTSKSATKTKSSIEILGGSFSTGSELSDKTYASIYVGKEHAGEDVTVQIWYSRDGSTLNNGNMVPASVHSDGYLEISSADSYKYYPDHATINIYDSSGSNLLDTQSVSLSPTSGTQSF